MGAVWRYRSSHTDYASDSASGRSLSPATQAALRGLAAPIELRVFTLLDPSSTTGDLQAFATRVSQLVTAYEREGAGQVVVMRQESLSDATAALAAADGLRPFNRHRGEPCFLGIAVAQNARKEVLAELSPDFEAALESDLTRAILRVASAGASPQARAAVSVATAPTDAAALTFVRENLPNHEALTLEEGRQKLRELGLKEFQAATQELASQTQAAQARFTAAQGRVSEADLQAARAELLQVQTEQAARLQRIAAEAQARLTAWEQLKGDAAATAPTKR